MKSKITTEEFVRRSRAIHGDKYDYSKSVYVKRSENLLIICPKHGEFWQSPGMHCGKQAQGCPKCGLERLSSLGSERSIGLEEFIHRSRAIHGDKYDYSKSIYKSSKERIVVICPEHGEFYPLPQNHIHNKTGCPKCAVNERNENLKLSHDQFINKARKIHGDKYEYIKSILDYISTITGKEISLFVDDLISGYELDIKVGDNLAIECNGDYWHSYNRKESPKERNKHYNKHDLCLEKNLKLIQISEFEWNYKRDIVKSILSNALNLSTRIYARKCSIVKLEDHETIDFLNTNHIQGYRSSSISYGLKYQDNVVAMITFSRNHKYQFEMMRYACSLNHVVVGGLSKLFNRFKLDYEPKMIVSYADRRYFSGKSYEHIGFKLDGVSEPNYKYIKGTSILSRQKCQKHKLHKFLKEFNDNLSESDNMFANGYRRLWDAGNWRYIYKYY